LPKKAARFENWNTFLRRIKNPKHSITIGLIGKCRNAGLLQIILEAFIHAGASNETKVNIISIHSGILML
jgi:CTP synthase